MGLTSWPLLCVFVLLAVLAPLGCLALWNRARGRVATPARLLMIVTCQALAVLLGGVGVNDYYEFYASWNDLIGGPPQNGGNTAIAQVGPGDVGRARFQRDTALDPGAYSATVTGERSGITSRVLVWTPPGYGASANAHQTYPVVELLPGYPGSPSTWFHAVHGVSALKGDLTEGRAHPFILVAPVTTVVPGTDTECVDFPRGPRVETWLTDDVRTAVTGAFRAQPDRSAWGLMGFSTGGYCAAKLAAHRPDLFAAAVTMQGDTVPQTRKIRADRALDEQNSVPGLLRTRRPPISLLLAGTRQDKASYAELTRLIPAIVPPTRAFLYVLQRGGHNVAVWNAMLPNAYAWLSQRLSAPRPS